MHVYHLSVENTELLRKTILYSYFLFLKYKRHLFINEE